MIILRHLSRIIIMATVYCAVAVATAITAIIAGLCALAGWD